MLSIKLSIMIIILGIMLIMHSIMLIMYSLIISMLSIMLSIVLIMLSIMHSKKLKLVLHRVVALYSLDYAPSRSNKKVNE